jgi:uncharacterized protein YlxW (UPF0749 family)
VLGVAVIMVIAGGLFGTSARTARGTQLRADQTDLMGLVADEDERVKAKARVVQRLRADVDARTSAQARGSAGAEQLQRRSQTLALAAGVRAATGPGLVVSLDDAPRTGAVPPGVKPDDLVVHQQDVQAVVNALWQGGAEAMMLMDQRVIATSAVRCVGNTLILKGRVYSPPFTVTALGDPARLRAALDASEQIKIYRQYVEVLGLGWKVSGEDRIRLPGFNGSLDLKYARVPSSAAGTATTEGTARP